MFCHFFQIRVRRLTTGKADLWGNFTTFCLMDLCCVFIIVVVNFIRTYVRSVTVAIVRSVMLRGHVLPYYLQCIPMYGNMFEGIGLPIVGC